IKSERRKYIGVTCDGNAEQIVQSVITTGSNIIQTFMTYISIKQSYSDENMRNFIILKEGKLNLTNDYKLIKLLEEYENDVPELKIVIHASIGLSINDKFQYDGKCVDNNKTYYIWLRPRHTCSLLNGQLPQEIFEMIMKHPATKAAILETSGKTNKQKNEQISEVYILRKYAGDLIAEDKELYASIEERVDAMLQDFTSKNLLPDIEIIDLTKQMNRLTI
ncbi:29979_t:CDS:2, partial [Racocetra persica]